MPDYLVGGIMKEIPLTQGRVAHVDDEDYELLSRWKWQYARGYAKRTGGILDGTLCRKSILMHRVILGAPEHLRVDHINGNRADNCKENLRLCTPEQNKWHVVKRKGNNKYKGTRLDPDGHWYAYAVGDNGRQAYLGYYASEEEAAIAYNRYAKKRWGEWTSLNPIADREIFPLTMDRRTKISSSGIYGVAWDKSRNKWHAKVRRGKSHIDLGRYDKKEDAAKAVKAFLEAVT